MRLKSEITFVPTFSGENRAQAKRTTTADLSIAVSTAMTQYQWPFKFSKSYSKKLRINKHLMVLKFFLPLSGAQGSGHAGMLP